MGFYQVVDTWVRWRLAAEGCTTAVGVTCLWEKGEKTEQEESDGENWTEQEVRKRN